MGRATHAVHREMSWETLLVLLSSVLVGSTMPGNTSHHEERSLEGVFEGVSITSLFKLHLPLPLPAENLLVGSSMVLVLPPWLKYTFPSSVGRSSAPDWSPRSSAPDWSPRSSRDLASEQESLYHWAEDLLSQVGLPGRECTLFSVCVLSQASTDMESWGLLGRVLEAVFLMDTNMDTTEGLIEYIQAKRVGEGEGNCEAEYQDCPVESVNLDQTIRVILTNLLQNAS